jgi:nucleotide-binding universal stress UspA family protein
MRRPAVGEKLTTGVAGGRRPARDGAPEPDPKEAGMYNKILVGYEDSDQARDALALGKVLADATGADLVVAGVFRFDPLWGGRDPAFEEAEAEYARTVERAAKSVGAEPEAVPSSSAARGLHELAEEIDADFILVGSAHHGRVGQVVAGSVGLALLHGTPCAVGLAPSGYRDQADNRISAVAVGLDGSAESGLALEEAIELARKARAKLKLVAVAEPRQIIAGRGGGRNQGWRDLKKAIEEETGELLRGVRETVPEDVDAEATLISGDPVETLAKVGTESGTVLILGSRGYGPLRRVLLGSVAWKLVKAAPCPLIVHPRGTHHESTAPRRAEENVTT